MADFNFYLNRQGIQGRKGDKGDAGFTPTISVSEQTLNSYKLKITNEYNEFETPNLIGNLGVTDNGGTYLRYDKETQQISAQDMDAATASTLGGVRLSTEENITAMSADTVVTPADVADSLPVYLQGEGAVSITQDEGTSKTKINVDLSSVNELTTRVSNAEAEIVGIQADVANLDTDVLALKDITTSHTTSISAINDNIANLNANKVSKTDFATTETAGIVKVDGTSVIVNENGTISAVGGGTGDIPIASATTLGGIKVGKNLTIDENGTLNATGGSGTAIDDATTSTTSTWSSSKINSEITTDIENLKNTKNNNIFDIGKFTVVGSPTITDDGIASGFSVSNVLRSHNTFAFNNKPFEITLPIYWSNSTPQGVPFHFSKTRWSNYLEINKDRVVFYLHTIDDGTDTSHTLPIWMNYGISFNDAYLMVSIKFDGTKYTLRAWNNELSFTRQASYNTSNPMSYADNLGYLDIGALYQVGNANNEYYKSFIDLKQFSITVDGKEVFNGLMESTKPIYDAIKANNTELSEFKTETSTDISAVNSALNEKANLTDLALKQNTLVSGTNIKTINGETILGEGNITVGGSTPANMVTTDTSQTITGVKTFETLKIKELNTAGSTEMFANGGLIVINNSEAVVTFKNANYLETFHGRYANTASMRFGEYDTPSNAQKISSCVNGSGSYGNLILEANSGSSDKSSLKLTKNSLTFTASDGTVTNLLTGGGSAPANMVTTDTAQDITANKTFYGEIRVGADNNYATLAKFSKEALASGDSTLLEHIDLGEASFVVQGSLGKKVYETDKYVYKKYINVDDLSDNQIAIDNSISSQVAHMATPSDKYIDLTIGASGTTYTAPADGWFIFRAQSTSAANTYIDTSVFYRNQIISTATYIVSFTGDTCGFVQQAPKGAILSFVYNATFGTISAFRFVYAKGSEPVA